MTSAAQVLAVAKAEIGYVGGPGNPPSSKYGAWYGINPGNWCAMFISWCGNEAAVKANSTNPYAGIETAKGFAYTPTGFAWFQGRNRAVLTSKQAQPGDLVFYDYGMGRISHVGLVESVSESGYTTIEGNTSNSSHRAGNTCNRREHTHNESVFRGIGRPAYDKSTGPVDGASETPSTTPNVTTGRGSNVPAFVLVGLVVVIGVVFVFSQA